MTNLRIRSARAPFDDPGLAAAAIGALSRADAMGLLSRPVTRLDDSAMRDLGKGMSEAGVGRTLAAELRRLPRSDPARLSSLLERISEALDRSPAPAQEWRVLHGVLGPGLLARLLGISRSSVRPMPRAAAPRPVRLPPGSIFWPLSSATPPARATTSASGAGSNARANA